MHKFVTTFLILCFCLPILNAQEENDSIPKTTESDSLKSTLRSSGVIMQDSLFKKKKNFNPLAPSKAAFYSAVFPGLGQIYNKRYWKVPIVYGAIGGSIYAYTWNNDNYQRFRTAFKRRLAGFDDDEFNGEGQFPFFDLDRLENQQERFQRDRDLWLVVSIGLYALNIIDANVDAHLKQFNIDDDLSFDFEPFLDLNQVTNDPTYGMALTIRF
ncbi:DUF5683 domain-containing protein [Maribacter aestuarii]|uniref:DUF5683 domain-containing protein n=1 Tax=Maribacter aestuarii TaxID=1130723 RepID=UPI00248B13D8|nr:DUF5683 domain-containing protein [Maribacter aestuarii]